MSKLTIDLDQSQVDLLYALSGRTGGDPKGVRGVMDRIRGKVRGYQSKEGVDFIQERLHKGIEFSECPRPSTWRDC